MILASNCAGVPVSCVAVLPLLLAVSAWAGPAVKEAPAAKESPAATAGTWSHAFAAYGDPKYPRDFKNFDYVNPDAPKSGTLYLGNPDRRTSFDKYNPFTTKGSEPTGVIILMFETLAVRSGDEPGTIYGLLAEEMLVPPDRSSITFRLNPKARFYNGDPVTAADVKHSYDMLIEQRRLAGRPRAVRRRQGRGGPGPAHDPLRPYRPHARYDHQCGHVARVLA